MNNELSFCQMPLDRASTLRKNSAWLQDKLSAPDSCFYFFWRGKFLYLEQEICLFTKSSRRGVSQSYCNVELFTQVLADNAVIFLGTDNEVAHFVCDLSLVNDIQAWQINIAIEALEFIEFRGSLALLNPQQAAILSYAKALIHWQQTALYCGCCGTKNQSLDGGHRRVCSNDACQKEHFPRTDPVVIMLVEYQPKSGPAVCLLAEHHRTPAQVFSTLAGFVDPGESLQEAVTREVLEEAGIPVSNVRYVDSQPWPFPNSIMLGFVAQAESMHLTLEQAELRSAHWFTAQQLTKFNEWGDDVAGPKLPRKESIARLLIDSWCQQQLAVSTDVICA